MGDQIVEGSRAWTCGSPGIGRKHRDYQFGRYEERNGLEGEPSGCAGGVGTDAVHGCEVLVSGMGKWERSEVLDV